MGIATAQQTNAVAKIIALYRNKYDRNKYESKSSQIAQEKTKLKYYCKSEGDEITKLSYS